MNLFKNRKITVLLGLLIVVLALAGCNEASGDEGAGELVVYSARNENFVNALLEKFEEDTGIEVQALHGGETIVNRVKEESGNVQGDVFISNDVGALEHLRMEGLLESIEREEFTGIDEQYRGEDNSWIALSARTRVLMYNKDLITEEEMPKNIWELTDSQYEEAFAITRGGNGGMIGHVSALRNEWGDERTMEWIEGVSDNAGGILQGHGDIRRAVGAGEFKFGLVNNYYFHQQLAEPSNNNVDAIYPDQEEGEMGAVVNAAGFGRIKDGPNDESLQAFVDWILEPENQQMFSNASLEVPINPDIEVVDGAKAISEYKVQGMSLRELGHVWEDTRRLIEESGLDLEIR
ncbi:extracellular solute-binding protein [Isachenkonia alkalipeptolytica]|uniref:Extracellular solute-binding protein n=1 Tax=Isachenkonia alkalipeptolytica TaxID=2565777 RepID=A0AA43XKR3_9CLOT|nr:extracellular solute-binding protein [Isachenkonia alkalipeptolytica]NBG88059.1 extracellular solute-binding protein [Isachenkonia alkalipeptolytica]